ncbi:MAG: DUF3237 domain-containing protein [Solirubrobacteraceae bacterium]
MRALEPAGGAGPRPAVELEHVFDYEVRLRPPVVLGRAQYGTRIFYEVLEGRISGPRLQGEVLSGGGDWALVDDDGWTRVDVRGQARSDDGALLYFCYRGLIEPAPAIAAALQSGGETSFEDQYWRASIEVETADPRYRWLTQSVLVGRGRICAGPGVAYQVFRIG